VKATVGNEILSVVLDNLKNNIYLNRVKSVQDSLQGKVLEIGVGYNSSKFISIDADKSSVADVIASATDLPFKDKSFDNVFSIDVIHHVSGANTTFEEVSRVLEKYWIAIERKDTGFAGLLRKLHYEKAELKVTPDVIKKLSENFLDMRYKAIENFFYPSSASKLPSIIQLLMIYFPLPFKMKYIFIFSRGSEDG
jgi:SAM-dependent methyltransferase